MKRHRAELRRSGLALDELETRLTPTAMGPLSSWATIMRQPDTAPAASTFLSNAIQPSGEAPALEIVADQPLGHVTMVTDHPMYPMGSVTDQPLGSVRMVTDHPMYPLTSVTDQPLGHVTMVTDHPMYPMGSVTDQPLGHVTMVTDHPMYPITSVTDQVVFAVYEVRSLTPDTTSTDSDAAAQAGSSAEEQVQTAVQKPLWAARQQWRSLIAQARATRLAAMRAPR